MTDYKEEQSNEIEALMSIYPDEIQILSTKPFHSFQMLVTSQCTEEVEDATCIIQFTYTAKYPDEGPLIEILSFDNIEQEDADVLLNVMKEQIDENLGMGMIFTLVSAGQEKLTDLVENAANSKKEREEAKIRAEEEAERKKFEGTRVTIETFLAWKEKFDAEIAAKNKDKILKELKENTKPSGKDLFMQDLSLIDSDMKFFEEEGPSVAVDESLFQDFEDLDIDEELEAAGLDS